MAGRIMAKWVAECLRNSRPNEREFRNRVKRVKELEGFVPDVTGAKTHMYRYARVQGKELSKVITLLLFDRLLEHCDQFWTKASLTTDESIQFKESCMRFYRNKTYERVERFYKHFDRNDGVEVINGNAMPALSSLLNSIDWEWLANGLPGRFHGYFHFENILWSTSDQRFVFLDWRQDFGGELSTGDIYYDFAKLLHGLIISHELIASNFFRVEWSSTSIDYDFHRKQVLVECERQFGSWLEVHGYDRKKVWILTALII